MESNNPVLQNINTVSNINDFLAQFKDEATVSNYVESITYDIKTQRVIIQMQKLVKEESEKVASRHSEGQDSADERIKRLSETYKKIYPELVDSFKKWKPVRENLVKLLLSSSNKLERNFNMASYLRVLTSAADIVGTLIQTGVKSDSSWAGFAMEHASTIGLMSSFIEITLSKKMHRDVNNAIKRDQELFKNISQWFNQTEELDRAIKNFFPYGIDTEITKEIAKSASDFDDYNKIFMSIVVSNAKKDVKLFTDRKFLDRADRIATSEAGKQWFHKIRLGNNNPCFNHFLNSKLNEEIQDVLNFSRAANPALYVNGWKAVSSQIKMKIILNIMAIISDASNILCDNKPEASVLKELSEKTDKELEEIRKIVCFLKPTESELDPVLR